MFRLVIGQKAKYIVVRAYNALKYILRGDWENFAGRVVQLRREGFVDSGLQVESIGILCMQHAMSVGYSFKDTFEQLGFNSFVLFKYDKSVKADLWLVVGAQCFRRLPPSGRRLIVQLEQTASDRWFDKRYKSVLLNSLGVIEFSRQNLDGLAKHGIAYPHVFLSYLSCFGSRSLDPADKNIDVLFYGDPNCRRRKLFLEQLSSRFSLHVVSNTFGEQMFDVIRRAKVVVNIHYYDDSNLETTRILECISLGTKVVSESSPDLSEYESLKRLVDFVPVGDVNQLCEAVASTLAMVDDDSELSRQSFIKSTQSAHISSVARILEGVGVVDVQLPESYHIKTSEPVVLSLPETVERYSRAHAYFPQTFQIIDGFRAKKGWVGCGRSYKRLAQQALNHDLQRLWVFEDDAELPKYPERTIQVINEFLDSMCGEWDIFCGLIARFDTEPKVFDVIEYRGIIFVVLDQMMSMVANAYSRNALCALSEWDDSNMNVESNTIDSYLNRKVSKVITTLPMQFFHNTQVQSTLWGIENECYQPLLSECESILSEHVSRFIKTKNNEPNKTDLPKN